MDIIGTSQVYYVSPAYILVIVVLVGFIYQLIRNQEYKNTLLSSTIIGIIITLLLVPLDNLMYFFLQMGKFIALVILGGFLAVGFKKLRTNETENFHELPENELESNMQWWSDQSSRSQTIAIFSVSLLGIILIISTVCFLDPIENSVELEIHSIPDDLIGMNYTDNGESIFFISKNSTKYDLIGSSEACASVTITSGDLGIYNQTIPLDAENKYAYNLNIPSNVSIIKVTLEATKPGKENRYISFFIKKE